MKIATYRANDAQGPEPGIAAVVDDRVVDLTYAYARYLRDAEHEERAYELADARLPRDMIGVLQSGDRAIEAARHAVDHWKTQRDARGVRGERLSYALAEVRLLAPIARPGKILAAGKNYRDHAAEGTAAGQQVVIQPFPRGFVKVSSVVVGPDDPVELAHVTKELDYEVELAVVIGKRGKYIPRERAYDYVAGYTILNDVSARDIQLAEAKYGNHLIGKNLDGLSPMGPWIVLKDEITDPMDLDLSLTINGQLRQKSNTHELIHDIPAMIERWSWGTLEPGDIIATGTPAGVALGGKFPYLKVGDVMECWVEGVGTLRNAIVEEHE